MNNVFCWQKPGQDLSWPVHHVCSEFEQCTLFTLWRYNQNSQGYFSLWVWGRFQSLDNLLSINFLAVDACSAVMLFWGSKWKTKDSAAGASFPFLPSCVLTISPFTLNKTAPSTWATTSSTSSTKILLNSCRVFSKYAKIKLVKEGLC